MTVSCVLEATQSPALNSFENNRLAVGKISKQALIQRLNVNLLVYTHRASTAFQQKNIYIYMYYNNLKQIVAIVFCFLISLPKQTTHRATVGRLRKHYQLDNAIVSRLALAD